ncbi:MAG: hypothetical protein Q7J07_07785 [Pelolinea sp.]|nr:hypothetical protein [Pelolinea sp.]
MTTLAAYRTRILNSLDDTNSKYSTNVVDEALRKVLNEYTRANPNFKTYNFTVVTAGRTQTLAAANLIVITKLVHPYDDSVTDPFIYEREDFTLTYMDGSPTLFFYSNDLPQVGEKIYIDYAAKQTITDLDSAVATTIRDDHEDILVLGAAGQAAMMRASGLNEQWGGRPGEMSALMTWGNNQYNRFLEFLEEIKQEVSLPMFPDSSWQLDQWDH